MNVLWGGGSVDGCKAMWACIGFPLGIRSHKKTYTIVDILHVFKTKQNKYLNDSLLCYVLFIKLFVISVLKQLIVVV